MAVLGAWGVDGPSTSAGTTSSVEIESGTAARETAAEPGKRHRGTEQGLGAVKPDLGTSARILPPLNLACLVRQSMGTETRMKRSHYRPLRAQLSAKSSRNTNPDTRPLPPQPRATATLGTCRRKRGTSDAACRAFDRRR